jgi:DNA modification methylase
MSDTYDPDKNSKGCFDLAISSLRERLEKSRVVIGDCTLYCEDAAFIVPTLMKVDALVTDPPYGIGESRANPRPRGKTVGTALKGIKRVLVRVWEPQDWDDAPISPELMDLIRSKAKYQIIFGGNFYNLPPTACWLVWDKLQSAAFADCELAWTNLNKAVRRIQYQWNGMLRANNEPRGDHPTQKPLGVMRWCVGQLPEDVETILDPFMGSGTTGVAAVKMGKKFIGIERERKYFDAACRRITEAYKQPDFFVQAPEKKPEQMTLV